MDVPVSTDFLGNVTTYVEKASAIFEASEKQAVDVSAQAKATLETLKKQGLCPADVSDEELLEKLSNPIEALKALDKTALQVPPPSLGTPHEVEKSASVPNAAPQGEAEHNFEVALGL